MAERLKISLNLERCQELYLSYLNKVTIEEDYNLAASDLEKLLELGEKIGIACLI